jgi:Family of unknown function (DUF6886)
MPQLLHFSEDPDIKVFTPHVPASSPDNPPLVWAVDEEHAPGFWFPRQAPRACCWTIGKPLTDIGRELLGTGTRMHAMETAWLERMRACRMYVYRFDPACKMRTPVIIPRAKQSRRRPSSRQATCWNCTPGRESSFGSSRVFGRRSMPSSHQVSNSPSSGR